MSNKELLIHATQNNNEFTVNKVYDITDNQDNLMSTFKKVDTNDSYEVTIKPIEKSPENVKSESESELTEEDLVIPDIPDGRDDKKLIELIKQYQKLFRFKYVSEWHINEQGAQKAKTKAVDNTNGKIKELEQALQITYKGLSNEHFQHYYNNGYKKDIIPRYSNEKMPFEKDAAKLHYKIDKLKENLTPEQLKQLQQQAGKRHSRRSKKKRSKKKKGSRKRRGSRRK